MTTWKTNSIGSFSSALSFLKAGERVTRSGWNGKGMWLVLIKMSMNIEIRAVVEPGFKEKMNCLPWIGMRTAQGEFVPWLASQTDLLADDWHEIIDA